MSIDGSRSLPTPRRPDNSGPENSGSSGRKKPLPTPRGGGVSKGNALPSPRSGSRSYSTASGTSIGSTSSRVSEVLSVVGFSSTEAEQIERTLDSDRDVQEVLSGTMLGKGLKESYQKIEKLTAQLETLQRDNDTGERYGSGQQIKNLEKELAVLGNDFRGQFGRFVEVAQAGKGITGEKIGNAGIHKEERDRFDLAEQEMETLGSELEMLRQRLGLTALETELQALPNRRENVSRRAELKKSIQTIKDKNPGLGELSKKYGEALQKYRAAESDLAQAKETEAEQSRRGNPRYRQQ